MELVACNVVVAANQFNPTVFSQLWLFRTGIVAEDDFLPDHIVTDAFAQVPTRHFHLLITPATLQFTPARQQEGVAALVSEKVGAIVGALEHTPYTAVGLNFVWHEYPRQGETVNQLTRAIFFRPNIEPFASFDRPESRFGAYMSKDFETFRLKLDVKPVLLVTPPEGAPEDHRIQVAFNFHLALGPNDPVQAIQGALARWDAAKAEAQGIVDRMTRR
jgi:hypothetical protein